MGDDMLDTSGMAALVGVKPGRVSMLLAASRRKVAAGERLTPTDLPLPGEVMKGRPYWRPDAAHGWRAARDAAGVRRGGPRGGGRPPKGPDAVTVRLVVEYRGRRAQVTRVSDGATDPAERAAMVARVLAHQAGAMLSRLD